MKVKSSSQAGFTLLEIMIVTTIIGLLVAIAIPNYIIARSNAQKNACINNLRQLDSAKQQWAFEVPGSSGVAPASYIGLYVGRGSTSRELCCPQDPAQSLLTSYNIGNVSTAPLCIIHPTGARAHAIP